MVSLKEKNKAKQTKSFHLLPAPQFLILTASPWLLLSEASLGPAFPMLQPSLGAKQYCLLSPAHVGLLHSSFLLQLVFCWGSVYVHGGVRFQHPGLQTLITAGTDHKS